MYDNIKENLKFNIAISQMKEEEKRNMKNKEKFIMKNIGIVACAIIVMSGGVYAVNKVIESIWKVPEKIEVATIELTEESKKENISEEEAKKIAIKKLKELKLNSDLTGETKHYKAINSNDIMYRFYTDDNYIISIKGSDGSFYEIWNENNIQDVNKYMSEKEATEYASKYYKLLGLKEGEYELVDIQAVKTFKYDFTYMKKYGDVYNPGESVFIGLE